jgi:hypothetical protein
MYPWTARTAWSTCAAGTVLAIPRSPMLHQGVGRGGHDYRQRHHSLEGTGGGSLGPAHPPAPRVQELTGLLVFGLGLLLGGCDNERQGDHPVATPGEACNSPDGFLGHWDTYMACTPDRKQVLRCVDKRWAALCACPGGCDYVEWNDGYEAGSELRCLNANGRLLDHGQAVVGQCVPGGCDPTAGTGTCQSGPSTPPWTCHGFTGTVTQQGCEYAWQCGDERLEIRCEGVTSAECVCLRNTVEEGRFQLSVCGRDVEAAANAACGWSLRTPDWP